MQKGSIPSQSSHSRDEGKSSSLFSTLSFLKQEIGGLSFLNKHPGALFHAQGGGTAQRSGEQRWGFRLRSEQGYCCLGRVDKQHPENIQLPCCNEPRGVPPRRPSNKDVLSQPPATSGFASAVGSCLAQRFVLSKVATSEDWR